MIKILKRGGGGNTCIAINFPFLFRNKVKTRYAKWRVSITLMTAQLVAGYLRGKPRSRSMHAATIKEHIKCTGYCRRDPYRQLLVSCCQPRRWTSRTYSYTGCSTSNRFSKLKTYSFQYSYLIQFPLLFVEFYICESLRINPHSWVDTLSIQFPSFESWF